MAIERLLRLELAFPAGRRDEVLRALHGSGIVHLEAPGPELLEAGAQAVSVSVEEPEACVAALSVALEVAGEHCPERRGLVRSFFPVPTAASPEELLACAARIDPAEVGRTAGRLRDRWRQIARFEAETREELAELEPFVDLPFSGRDLPRSPRVRAVLGSMPAEGFEGLCAAPPGSGAPLAWEEVRRRGDRVWVLAAFPAGAAEAALADLRALGFEELPLPQLAGSAAERAAQLRRDLERVAQEREAVRREAGHLARDRREIELALACWEDRRELRGAAARTAVAGRVGLLTGYVRERHAPELRRLLDAELPYASAELREPGAAEDVPVSIRLPAPLRPMQLFIDMYGLPNYRAIDPTPWLTLSFLVFFGACFGDVVYGLGLCAMSLYVMLRYRHARWTRGFFQLFLYAGISATIFGLVTGSWMGDLLVSDRNYLGPDFPLARLARACMLMDPVARPVLALALAVGIGVVNQLYGLTIKFVMEFRRRNFAAAFFDAGLWLVVLPGLMLFAAGHFVPEIPAAAGRAGLWAALAGMAGLVLTQGRDQQGLLAKAIYGVVSLYGILGSYGVVGFFGDVLSYSRLVALGLATSIIGLSVNVMAGMLEGVPRAGPLLFVLMLILGHGFNWVMSILGSFVHPARLILLEFFGRFYESGGRKFQPLGFHSARVEVAGSGRG